MKIIVFGTGFVAQAYLRALHYLGHHPIVASRSWIRYDDHRELKFFMRSVSPDIIVNCAGFVGENSIDDCYANPIESCEANRNLPALMAINCKFIGCRMIHISTGCMFYGSRNWTEKSTPNFKRGVYQDHKFKADRLVTEICPQHWIYRIRMPFSQFSHPRNWLTKLSMYKKIIDGENSATWIDEFAMRSWQLSWSAAGHLSRHAAGFDIHAGCGEQAGR